MLKQQDEIRNEVEDNEFLNERKWSPENEKRMCLLSES